MMRWLLGLAAAAVGGTAPAQVYGAPGSNGGAAGGANPLAGLNGAFAPNVYNRSQQPLSPYLNLLRGGDPGVNYFYGVRPGLAPGVAGPAGGGAFGGSAFGPPGAGNRFYLQPPAGSDELSYQPLEANQRLRVLPSAAHPVVFGNGPGLGGIVRATARGGVAPAPRGGPTPPRR